MWDGDIFPFCFKESEGSSRGDEVACTSLVYPCSPCIPQAAAKLGLAHAEFYLMQEDTGATLSFKYCVCRRVGDETYVAGIPTGSQGRLGQPELL